MPRSLEYFDAVFDVCGHYTALEFVELAKACLDQAGLSVATQERVAAIVDGEIAASIRADEVESDRERDGAEHFSALDEVD